MNISFLFFFTLIPWLFCAPPPDQSLSRKREHERDGVMPKRPKLPMDEELSMGVSKKCVYEGGRQSVPGKITRPYFSEVSSTCSFGDHTELSKLTSPNEFLGTRHELQLISVRGSGAFGKDFTDPQVIAEYSNQFICGKHREELSTGWNNLKFPHFAHANNGNPKCSYPDNRHGEKRPLTRGLGKASSTVVHEEAKAVMTLEKILLPVGLPVCDPHKEQLRQSVIQLANVVPPTSPPIPTQIESAPVESSNSATVSPAMEKAVRAFAIEVGEKRLIGWKPWNELDERTKQKKIVSARKVIDVFFKGIAKEESKGFAEKVLAPAASVYTEKRFYHKMHNMIVMSVKRFNEAIGRRDKLVALAYVAKAVSLPELRRYIPGLAERMYYNARSIALNTIKIDTEVHVRQRYPPAKMAYYMSYITSPEIMSDLPFGSKKITTSDGTKYSIPNSLRLQRATEIVNGYIKKMNDNNLGHMLFGKSTLYKILSYCVATEMKASVCVDSFLAEAELAHRDLNDLLKFLLDKGTISRVQYDELDAKLKDIRSYHRGDYRLHTRIHSRVADHCWTHALSDPNDARLSGKCNNQIPGESHAHDLKCERCEMAKSVMKELMEFLEEMYRETVDPRLKEEIKERRAKLEKSESRIEEYKKHQLRSAFSYKIREQMIAESEETVATVVLDFGQKFLPMKHMEAQPDYFGKTGMTYHVTHIQTSKNGRIAQHQMIHIVVTNQQDAVSVVQIIRHMLEELKNAEIEEIFLKSDNAGCYHSAYTIAAVYQLAKEVGVRVRDYGFSESQNGKSPADRGSGMIKNKARAFVDAGGDANSHEKFFTAVTSGRLLEGTSVYLVSTEIKKAPKVNLDKISGFFDFQYEEKGIRLWRHKNIGEGIFVPATSFVKDLSSLPRLTVIKRGGHLPEKGVGFWKLSPILPDGGTCQRELPSLLTATDKKQFHCPEITCSSSFDTAEELEAHWLTGQHCSSPLQTTMRDDALKMYSAGLEHTISLRLNIPEVDDAIKEIEQSEFDAEENEPVGFALKKRKPALRHSQKVKDYVENLFDLGVTRKKKIPGEEAEIRMANEKMPNGERMFSIEERIDARQIESLYSRIAAAREKAGAATKSIPPTFATSDKPKTPVTAPNLKKTTPTPTATTTKKATKKPSNRKTTNKPKAPAKNRGVRSVDEEINNKIVDEKEKERRSEVNTEDADEDENSGAYEAWFLTQQEFVEKNVYDNLHDIFDLNQEVEVDQEEIFTTNRHHGGVSHMRHRRHLH